MIFWDFKENSIKRINIIYFVRNKRENNLGECYVIWII